MGVHSDAGDELPDWITAASSGDEPASEGEEPLEDGVVTVKEFRVAKKKQQQTPNKEKPSPHEHKKQAHLSAKQKEVLVCTPLCGGRSRPCLAHEALAEALQTTTGCPRY